jgi:single-strand DNA-binding protein
MGSVNEVTLMGHLGQDPDTKVIANGNQVTTISLATNESWTNKEGKKEQHTEWHRVVFWGKLAETVSKHFKKGSRIYVRGKLQTRSWDDQQGVKRYVTEIIGSDIEFIDTKSDANARSAPPNNQAPSRQARYEDHDSDVPF